MEYLDKITAALALLSVQETDKIQQYGDRLETARNRMLETMIGDYQFERDEATADAKRLYAELQQELALSEKNESACTAMIMPAKEKGKLDGATARRPDEYFCDSHDELIRMVTDDKINAIICPVCGKLGDTQSVIIDEPKTRMAKPERTQPSSKDIETLQEHLQMIEGEILSSKNNTIDPADRDRIMTHLAKRYPRRDDVNVETVRDAIRTMPLRRCCKFATQIYREFTSKGVVKFTDAERYYIQQRYCDVVEISNQITIPDHKNLPMCNMLIWKIIQTADTATLSWGRKKDITRFIHLPDTQTVQAFEKSYWAHICMHSKRVLPNRPEFTT